MLKLKPWESTYSPGHEAWDDRVRRKENPFLRIAEGASSSHPITDHALLLKVNDWFLGEVLGTLPKRIRDTARPYRISILNHGWTVDGVIVNFRSALDAARFRLVWEDDETVQCTVVTRER